MLYLNLDHWFIRFWRLFNAMLASAGSAMWDRPPTLGLMEDIHREQPVDG
jgi:hypothetical protein